MASMRFLRYCNRYIPINGPHKPRSAWSGEKALDNRRLPSTRSRQPGSRHFLHHQAILVRTISSFSHMGGSPRVCRSVEAQDRFADPAGHRNLSPCFTARVQRSPLLAVSNKWSWEVQRGSAFFLCNRWRRSSRRHPAPEDGRRHSRQVHREAAFAYSGVGASTVARVMPPGRRCASGNLAHSDSRAVNIAHHIRCLPRVFVRHSFPRRAKQ